MTVIYLGHLLPDTSCELPNLLLHQVGFTALTDHAVRTALALRVLCARSGASGAGEHVNRLFTFPRCFAAGSIVSVALALIRHCCQIGSR